jgi:hypothetical protein
VSAAAIRSAAWSVCLASLLTACATVAAPDPAGATFVIEGKTVTLVAGRAEVEAAPGSASKVVTTLGAEKAVADLDGDGRRDAAVTLVQQPGGSGSFTYLAVVLSAASGLSATNAIRIGDRIKVTGLRVDSGVVVLDYLDRAPTDPFTTAPSIATTKRFAVKDGKLQPQ